MKNTGFTLIELIIVMTLIGILAAIAAPSFVRSQQNKKNYNIIRDIESSLSLAYSLARSERVQTQAKVESNTFIIQSCSSECTTTEEISIPDNIKLPQNLHVVFEYPHGDISTPTEKTKYTIEIEGSNNVTLFVWPLSGLIYSQQNHEE